MAASSVRRTFVEVANLLADLVERPDDEVPTAAKRRRAARPTPRPEVPVSELDKEKARRILRNAGMKVTS